MTTITHARTALRSLERALREHAFTMTDEERLAWTLDLLHARLRLGMPARLVGVIGKMGPFAEPFDEQATKETT